MKTEELTKYPWPFPQWNGSRWVMPLELAPKELQAQAKATRQEVYLDDVEEAPF